MPIESILINGITAALVLSMGCITYDVTVASEGLLGIEALFGHSKKTLPVVS